ncbi:DNA topology modulation protein FlaR [Bacillus sp. 2205SS5-2]|uniref:DNA topology modulation protein FlaR n=1 Tax=Bacillus sp. 2205SS5-2 TaxID=3109031 RepID=UPI003005F2DB
MRKQKIHIIGSVGSGKTTLAKTLASTLGTPYYELDNMVWKRSKIGGDIRNTERERDQQLNEIVATDEWIVEGAHHDWVKPSLDRADRIIFLNVHVTIRVFRIIKRFVKQILRLEKANYHPSFQMLVKMFKWTIDFEKERKKEVEKLIYQYEDKVIVLKDNRGKELDKISS